MIARADAQIGYQLWHGGALMDADAEVAWLFLFHRSGFVREAALRRIAAPPATPFFFAALAWRMNDWVPEVRTAAAACARRVFPLTAVDVVVPAALVLFHRRSEWRRWGDEATVVDDCFRQPDVAARVADLLRTAPTGPSGALLRRALRYDSIDAHLPRLARESLQPAVRAVALGTLLERRAKWPEGFAWEWVDKVYGDRRRVRVLGSRAIDPLMSTDELVRVGLQDSSAAVRRVALDCLIRNPSLLPDLTDWLARLMADPSPSIRERAEYLDRHRSA
jgi:hypothetical protein